MNEMMFLVGLIVLQSVALLIALLIVVSFLIYADRKVWAAVQLRRGPNVVGPFGLLQSFADLLKFVFKEVIIPDGANKGVFVLAPIISAALSLAAWAVVPVAEGWSVANINVGILYLFALSSLGVYGIIMGGWASNSKYPFLSALRSAAQMVSYEVSIGFVIITVLLCAGSLNLTEIVKTQETGLGTMLGLPNSFLDWYFIPLFPMFIVFFVSALAETNFCPGSYDPVTNGHIDVIRRAALIFDRIVVGVIRDPLHKQTLFSVEERVMFLEGALAEVENVVVDVFSELVVDFARKHSAQTMVKGLRVISDFEWEFQMNHLNRQLAPEIETVYVMASPLYSFVSSSGVKEIASFGGRVDELVPAAVAHRFAELYPDGRPGAPVSPQE